MPRGSRMYLVPVSLRACGPAGIELDELNTMNTDQVILSHPCVPLPAAASSLVLTSGTAGGGASLVSLVGPLWAVLDALEVYVGDPGRPWAEKWPEPKREGLAGEGPEFQCLLANPGEC